MCCYRLLGRIEIRPVLSVSEHEYLLAFAESRRWRRPDGPYAVPGNPAAECLSVRPEAGQWATPAAGQPGLYCPWRPADDGGALVPHTDEDGVTPVSADEAAAWLCYLLDHFLGPDPVAADDSHFSLVEVPDDGHRFDGAAVLGDDAGRLSAIRAHGRRVSLERLTSRPDPTWSQDRAPGRPGETSVPARDRSGRSRSVR